MPHEYMSDSVLRTASPAKIFSPVIGQMPPFASDAAMTAADSAFTSVEHSCAAHAQRQIEKIIENSTTAHRCVATQREAVGEFQHTHTHTHTQPRCVGTVPGSKTPTWRSDLSPRENTGKENVRRLKEAIRATNTLKTSHNVLFQFTLFVCTFCFPHQKVFQDIPCIPSCSSPVRSFCRLSLAPTSIYKFGVRVNTKQIANSVDYDARISKVFTQICPLKGGVRPCTHRPEVSKIQW